LEEGGKDPKDITFKTEKAFDRAKFNSDVTDKIITKDQVSEKKSVDDVIKNATRYYSELYRDSLKKIDSAYVEDNFYDYSVNNSASDRSAIIKKIDSGEAVTGKEIESMAVNSANVASESVKALKNSEVIKIIETIGIDEIESMDGFYDAISTFEEALSTSQYTYEKSLEKLKEYLISKEEPKGNDLLEINAIVSAFASILNQSGFKTPIIEKEAGNAEKNIKLLLESKDGKIEGNVEANKEQKESAEGVLKTEENKLAETNTPAQENKVAQSTENKETPSIEPAKAIPTEEIKNETSAPSVQIETQNLEKPKEEKKETQEATKTESSVTTPEKKETIESVKKETIESVKKEETAPSLTKSETDLAEKTGSTGTFIDDIFKGTLFEGLVGKFPPVSEMEGKIESASPNLEKSVTPLETPKENKETKLPESVNSVTKIEENKTAEPKTDKIPPNSPVSTTTETKLEEKISTPTKVELSAPKESSIESNSVPTLAPKPLESLGVKESINLAVEKPITKEPEKKKGKIGSFISKAIEKIKDKNETLSEDKGINLKSEQKLSIKAPEIKKDESKKDLREPDKITETEKTVNKQETKPEVLATNENKATAEKEKEVVVDTKSLEEKMDQMIALLSMLNDTLQGPLLVSSNNKNFE